MATITTLAGLRAISTPLANEVYEITDYGTGLWYYDPSDTTSLDNTGTVVRSGSYRFKRVYADIFLHATWFGVKADGNTDDYDAMQNAINTTNTLNGGTLILPSGTIYLNKAGSTGGLALPANSLGLTIRGEDENATIIKLSKNVPRTFDIPGNDSITTPVTYKNLTIENFTVDFDHLNSVGKEIGPTLIAASDAVLVSGNTYTLNVTSTIGLLNQGLLFLPNSNSGTAKGQICRYTILNLTTIQIIVNLVSTTISAGDILVPTIVGAALIGSNAANGSTGVYGYNQELDNIAIQDIKVINVTTIVPTANKGNSEAMIGIINLATLNAPGYSGILKMTNVSVKRVKAYGGYVGFSLSGLSDKTYLNNILIEDCFHDTMVVPTRVYNGLNYLIGDKGFGGNALIKNCIGRNAGDVGCESDALTNVMWQNILIENAWTTGFYHTNFTTPTANPAGPKQTSVSNNGVVTSTATSFNVSSLPLNIANNGYLAIESELMYYSITAGSNTIEVFRGLNSTPGVSHPDGSIVTFVEVEQQYLAYENCIYRNTDVQDALLSDLGIGWFQQRNGVYPKANTLLKNCKYERYGGSISNNGEAIQINGANPSVSIEGFIGRINGLYSTRSIGASAISINNTDYGPNGAAGPVKPTAFTIQGLDMQINGTLAGNDKYRTLYLMHGNFYLDWSDLNISMDVNTLLTTGQILGIHFSFLSNFISGSINKYKLSTSGDPKPTGIFTFDATIVGRLTVRDIDYSNLFYDTSSSSNYVPFAFSNLNKANILTEAPLPPVIAPVAPPIMNFTPGSIISSGSKTLSGSSTTFTVVIPTLPNSTYRVAITPTSASTSINYYITNKQVSSFDVVFSSSLSSGSFDWFIYR